MAEIALLFTSTAALWQKAIDGERSGLAILLALPGYAFGVLGVLIGVGLAGAGIWGLQDPAGLRALGVELKTAAQAWLETI